jgi:hypothetical protein
MVVWPLSTSSFIVAKAHPYLEVVHLIVKFMGMEFAEMTSVHAKPGLQAKIAAHTLCAMRVKQRTITPTPAKRPACLLQLFLPSLETS